MKIKNTLPLTLIFMASALFIAPVIAQETKITDTITLNTSQYSEMLQKDVELENLEKQYNEMLDDMFYRRTLEIHEKIRNGFDPLIHKRLNELSDTKVYNSLLLESSIMSNAQAFMMLYNAIPDTEKANAVTEVMAYFQEPKNLCK